MDMPAFNIFSKMGTVRETGPRVHTIFDLGLLEEATSPLTEIPLSKMCFFPCG